MAEDNEMPGLGFLGRRTQLAFVVRDLDAALRYWTETLGVGPFVVIETAIDQRTVTFRGQQTDVELSLAFAYMGDVQIEIVHQLNDAPSPYTDFLNQGREGLQHIGYWPEDFEGACARLEEAGFTEICTFAPTGGARNVVYFDPPGFMGTTVEIMPWTDVRNAYFSRIRRLSDEWDGTRPVRRFRTRGAFLDSGEGAE